MTNSKIIGGSCGSSFTRQNKVYCRKCKHMGADGRLNNCGKNPVVSDTCFRQSVPEYARCTSKNRKNDCSDFEPTLWERVKKWLNRVVSFLFRDNV